MTKVKKSAIIHLITCVYCANSIKTFYRRIKMSYSAVGIVAALVLIIENLDIMSNRNGAFGIRIWKIYRRFLFSVLIFYFTDILWGLFYQYNLKQLLFIDTALYFIMIATTLWLWSTYVVAYLCIKGFFGKFFLYAGRIVACVITLCSILNFFVPVMFIVKEDGSYKPLAGRYIVLDLQIFLLVILAIYSAFVYFRLKKVNIKSSRYRIISLFGLFMTAFMVAQVYFPPLPLCAIAYLLGTCLLRAFVISEEKEEYRMKVQEAEQIRTLKKSVTSLLDNMPALSFSKDAKTGIYLACNQAFAEYAHKKDPEGVIGLTDAQIFDKVTAEHFVDDDKMALSMDEPYIFFEDVPDAAGNQRQFQTTKLKFIDTDGRLCTLGMCQDVTDMVSIRREYATSKEEYEKARKNSIIFTRIAQTLSHGYADMYYVDLNTDDFIEFNTDPESGELKETRCGSDFFESCKAAAKKYVFPEDLDVFLNGMKRENVLNSLEKNGFFTITYRLITKKGPYYVALRINRIETDNCIVVGVTDVNDEMKQRTLNERLAEQRTAYTRLSALFGDLLYAFIVNPETGQYREFGSKEDYNAFNISKDGQDFFTISRKRFESIAHPDDLEKILSAFTLERMMEEIDNNGIFAINYRLKFKDSYRYVQLKANKVEETEGTRLIVGLMDTDALVRQEEDFERRLSQAQTKANIDALTGVKTKFAYLEAESRLNRRIENEEKLEFAIAILDVNDLKKINDNEGHQAGDRYLRDACKIICDTFKRSPVYRVGGDEFAVVIQGDDFKRVEKLAEKFNERNIESAKNGGIVIACGVSKFEKDSVVAEVYKRADRNMYENKNMLKSIKRDNV